MTKEWIIDLFSCFYACVISMCDISAWYFFILAYVQCSLICLLILMSCLYTKAMFMSINSLFFYGYAKIFFWLNNVIGLFYKHFLWCTYICSFTKQRCVVRVYWHKKSYLSKDIIDCTEEWIWTSRIRC